MEKKNNLFETKNVISAMTIKSKLPRHIIEVIFSKLTRVNFSILRLVCKEWNDLVISKFFSNTFLVCTSLVKIPRLLGVQTEYEFRIECIEFDEKHHEGMNTVASFKFDSFDYPIRMANSCHGLLCIIRKNKYYKTSYATILNPMTNECIKLPGHEQKDYYYGFGFSPKLKSYKVARICFSYYRCDVEICTLGKSNEWSHVGYLPFYIDKDGVYFEGALYWIGRKIKNKTRLCRFDIEDEKFDIIDVPKLANYVTIGVLNDYMYASIMEIEQPHMVEVWMMQSSGRDNGVWTLGFVVDRIQTFGNSISLEIPWKDLVQLIKTYENGEILCLFDRTYLFLYSSETGRTRTWFDYKGDQKSLWIYPIETLNFDSLPDIFVVDS